MTPHQLATDLLRHKITDITFDANLSKLFPDFNRFFSSEKIEVSMDFVEKYLQDCKVSIDFPTKEVLIIREERIPGAGIYKNKIARVSYKDRVTLAQALMAAALYAYHYLFS